MKNKEQYAEIYVGKNRKYIGKTKLFHECDFPSHQHRWKWTVDLCVGLQRNRHAIGIPLAVILIATVFDAARDVTIGKLSWLAWHAIKWVAFYTPLIWIVWRERWKPITIAIVVLLSFLLWEMTSKILGRPW
jgi:hypothetical protein